jgi:hypothetical protein
MFCADFAKLFGLPLCHRDRRRTIGSHEPVPNKTGLRSEDRDAIGVNLMEDALGFG